MPDVLRRSRTAARTLQRVAGAGGTMDTRTITFCALAAVFAAGGCVPPSTNGGVGGELSESPDLAERPDLGGTLEAAVDDPSGAVDLTADGVIDWVHWGVANERSVTRKSGVAPCIADARLVDRGLVSGGAELHQYLDNHVRFSWSDGTPAQTVHESSTGVFVLGVGRGFALSAPADETTSTLTVYLSGFLADFEVTARVSDGSASEYRDVVRGRATGPGIYRRYVFVYHARTPGQRLDVEWVNLKDWAGGGNVTLQAATLR
jgi:hypothetical protein